MRIGIGDLEDARRNPVAFIRNLESGEKPFIRSGYYSVLQNAILRFHKDRLTPAAARSRMTEAYHRLFSTNNGLEEITGKFDEYIPEYRRLGNDTPITRHPIRLLLPDDLKDAYTVTGQLPRLDVTMQGGYAAWFFSKTETDWNSELRLPLIQGAVAADLAVESDEVTVGVYCFSRGRHIAYSFNELEIAAAMAQLCDTLREMQRYAQGNA